MHVGLLVSLILHGALLGWALLAIVTTPPLVVQKPEPVEVAIVSADDIVRLKQGDRESKNIEAEGKEGPAKEPPKKETPKPTPPPPPVAAAPPPPPPEPEPPKPDPIAKEIEKAAVEPPPPKPPEPPKVEPPKVEPPKPDPIGDLAAAAATQPPPPKPEPPKVVPPKPAPPKPATVKPATPPPPKKQPPAKAQDFASLINDAVKKAPESTSPPKALVSQAPVKAAPAAGAKSAAAAKGPAAGAPEGTDKVLTADKLSMLNVLMKNNVKRCWNINAGLEGAAKLIVKAEFKLTQDGRLIGDPRIVNSGSGPQFEDAANSAKRALIECQPYTNLPPELYAGGWDFMLLTFDPGKMF